MKAMKSTLHAAPGFQPSAPTYPSIGYRYSTFPFSPSAKRFASLPLPHPLKAAYAPFLGVRQRQTSVPDAAPSLRQEASLGAHLPLPLSAVPTFSVLLPAARTRWTLAPNVTQSPAVHTAKSQDAVGIQILVLSFPTRIAADKAAFSGSGFGGQENKN